VTLFERDSWQEIFETMRKNKTRTFLTAFSVAWGIFILVILSGAGNGLRNGAQSQFGNDAVNSIWIDAGNTSMVWNGLKTNREIQLTSDDYELIRNIADIDHGTAVFRGWGSKTLSYKKEHAGFTVRPVMPDHRDLEKAKLIKGRFINNNDIKNYLKVCAIGKPVEEALFKKEESLGKYIDVENGKYMVVGVFFDKGNNDNNRIYIPLTTAQRSWNGGKKNVNTIWVSTGTATIERSQQITAEIRRLLARRHNFDPRDPDAVGVYNGNAEYQRVMNMLTGIKIFVTIIGIFTLIAGIVGVSNIMMIIVKERTREIGIRKALGATPASIVSQIMMESIFITGTAGYTGLVLGVGIIEAVKTIGIDSEFFKNPDIDFGMAIFSVILLVIAGAFAGLVPSLRASRIEPVNALRED